MNSFMQHLKSAITMQLISSLLCKFCPCALPCMHNLQQPLTHLNPTFKTVDLAIGTAAGRRKAHADDSRSLRTGNRANESGRSGFYHPPAHDRLALEDASCFRGHDLRSNERPRRWRQVLEYYRTPYDDHLDAKVASLWSFTNFVSGPSFIRTPKIATIWGKCFLLRGGAKKTRALCTRRISKETGRYGA